MVIGQAAAPAVYGTSKLGTSFRTQFSNRIVVMSTIGTILSLILGVAFAGAGGTKVANVGPHEAEFPRYRLPAVEAQRARVLVGLTELVAALLLLIAAIASSTGLAVVGAIIVILTMIGAVATHARIGDPPPKMAPATVLGVLGVLLLILA
ncbi:MAG: DoxX-like family [Solirubrobacteraceae bacterium]|nr:DoxX-like family [Solirubrobacteraceae bacterium]